ncbi:MBL fold metallo-hydrolase [Psychrobacter sp. DM8]|uniref:MBL fold metallo-hydrolase n=1 Tax=Psychrobacter sp. DM8 TaxID=3440636 RepID=UPI003F4F6830
MSLIDIVAIEGYIQTTYMAVYPDKLLLLDSGCLCDVEHILTYITYKLERPAGHLKTVMVTHMHPDHAGGAELLKQKTGCQIVSAKSEKSWYQGISGRISHLNDLGLTYYVAHRQGKSIANIWYNPNLKVDIEVQDGDPIPNFADWMVLETPGHTDRDLSLWHAQTKQVYTADLILIIRDKFVSPYLITLPDAYRSSLDKVKSLQPALILLAHDKRAKICDKDFDRLIARAPKEPRKTSLKNVLSSAIVKFRFARKRVKTP